MYVHITGSRSRAISVGWNVHSYGKSMQLKTNNGGTNSKMKIPTLAFLLTSLSSSSVFYTAQAFSICSHFSLDAAQRATSNQRLYFTLEATANSNKENRNDIDTDNEDIVEPGTMRVSEIKSELDLRKVDYSDCFDKESLAQKLVQARAR